MSERKPILCMDFDGVIHSYSSGWKGAAVIPDPPVPGALEFLAAAADRFDVHIFSSRSNQPGGIAAMKRWMADWFYKDGGEIVDGELMTQLFTFPTEKPPALVTIDDRAICFTGEWPTLDEIATFQPWNKK